MKSSYTAVIIDDEEKQRAMLLKKISQLEPQIEVVGQAGDAESGAELIRESSPQIIFLDIRMPKGSGFDMLERLGGVSQEVIFITGFDLFALQALKISAVDYLLKPVPDEELSEAIQKAIERIRNKEKVQNFELLEHNIKYQSDQRSKIALPGVNSVDLVEIAQIIRCEGEQRYTRLYLVNGASLLSSYNIGVFVELLDGYKFIPTHKSHLVNLHHIKSYLKEGIVVLSDDTEVPVSRRRKEEVKNSILTNP